MNAIEALLDKPIFQALGWTLINFIWQGALIAVLYASVSVLLRRFSTNVRYAAACAAMLLMLIAPATTIFVISRSAVDSTAAGSPTAETIEDDQAVEPVALSSSSDRVLPATQAEIEPDPSSSPNSMMVWARERLPRAMPSL
jgi:hypothetical protein